ncbi:MAG: tetratricopeptide repeat protein, partial [Planctomycetaceae bacterium]|nr:tetratricopeptide repeat protein [Planctomycetaceae bacterium]
MTHNEKIEKAQNALINGDTIVAEEIYQEILREDAGNLCALDGLGIIRCQNNEPASGIEYFNEALHRLRKENAPNPRSEASLFFHLGLAYRSLGNRDEALKVLSAADRLSPDEPDLLLNLGQVYYETGQVNEAVGYFQHLTEVQTDNVSTWLTLGYILFQQEQYNEAAECLKTAELLDSESPEICLYLAESLRKAERFEESVPHYQKMLQVGADYPQAVHGFGKTLLALGHFADGWDAMEFRFASSLGTWERHQLPNWSPELNTQPQRVLAYSEEGLSAEVMFASCLPDLINNVEHCVVECDPALHHLFKRSFPRAEIVPLTSVNIDE